MSAEVTPSAEKDARLCDMCGHADHRDTDCGEVVGYDHLNGDHECGCPGSLAGQMTAIDAKECAFVCWVDLDGKAHMHSEAGYSQRQVAEMLRQMADICERRADEADTRVLPPAETEVQP